MGMMLVLAGCGGGGSEGNQGGNTTQIKIGSKYLDQLKALDEMNRGLTLRRAVQDANHPCKRAVSSAYQEDYKNLSFWTLRCSDSGDWGLYIAPNGDVQVRSCRDIKTVGLPECKIEEAAAQTSEKR
jgi:hypothetical protein